MILLFSPLRLRTTTLTLTVAICSVAAWAGIGFQPVSADELKMTGEPQAPGAHAVILYRQIDRDDNRFTPHEDDYIRIKVLTEEGRKYGNLEIRYAKGIEDVTDLHARTIRPDGSVVSFAGDIGETTLAKGHATRYFAKTLVLPDVQVGGIIEYYYTIDFKEHNVFESHWILSQDLFTRNARFSLKPYHSDFNNFHARWSWQGLPPGTEPKEGPDHIIRMDAANMPAFQNEDFMPPADEMKVRVDFLYEEELGELDPDRYWKGIGKARNGHLESFVGKHKTMEEAVAQLVSPDDTQEVKLHKIYDRVLQVRNTSFELRKTEQEQKREKEKIDENVEDVWKRGYGNGVQITWLFLALVRAAGFEAYGCWVADRAHYFFTPKTMYARRLDANVVLVKVDGKDRFFEPGGAFVPFGMMAWSRTGVQGLRLDKDGGTWIQTTLPRSTESRLERKAQLRLLDSGELEGKVTVSYSGLEAMYHRIAVTHDDDVARKKFLEDRLRRQIPVEAQVELTNRPDWANAETPLVAEFDIKVRGWATRTGKRAFVPAGVFTAGEKQVFEHENRVHPIYYEYPFEKSDDVTIELPTGWQVTSLPPPISQEGRVITFSLKAEGEKNALHLSRKLNVDILLLDRKYYAALRNFYQTVRTSDDQQIAMQTPAEAASN